MSIFNKIKVRKPRRSNFDLSHEVKLTTEFARLTPFLCMEVMPGDTIRLSSQIFARMAPMIAPIMSRVDVYTHFFFVPNRLLWDNFEKFITGGEDGTEAPVAPCCSCWALDDDNLREVGSLADYLGVPTNKKKHNYVGKISVLPFKAYQKIYNDWYRDQNLEEEIPLFTEVDGWHGTGNTMDEKYWPLFQLRQRAWQKDYFTSALPWAQRGPEVNLPMNAENATFDVRVDSSNRSSVTSPLPLGIGREGEICDADDTSPVTLLGTNNSPIRNISGPTINELRRSIRVQEWLEKNARGGSRYIEQIFSHFGVKSSDARLQRAELLGGGKSPILISEVLQNSQTTQGEEGSPQGNMSGHGVTAQATHSFKRFFEEHGFVIGIMSVMPKAAYQDGLPRMFTRFDKLDYPWPEFANLGEQEILNKELYLETPNADAVFGYAPRYSEFKYFPSSVHGDFRESLDFWHLGRRFAEQPNLNKTFITPDVSDLNRIFAVDKGDHFWIQVYNGITAKRPLPYYGVPTI